MPEKKNRLVIDGCVGSYTLSENEPATAATCNDLIIEGQSAGVLNIDIMIPMFRATTERVIIEAHGFAWAGTLSRGTPKQTTYACFRRCVRTTGSESYAIAPPTLAPLSFEQQAIEQMRERMSAPVDDALIARLQEGRSC